MAFSCCSCNPPTSSESQQLSLISWIGSPIKAIIHVIGGNKPDQINEEQRLLQNALEYNTKSCCTIFFGAPLQDSYACRCDHLCSIAFHTDQFWLVAKASWDHKLPHAIMALVAGASSFLGPTALLEPDKSNPDLSIAAIVLGGGSWLFSSLIKYNARNYLTPTTSSKWRYAIIASAIAASIANLATTYSGMGHLWRNTGFQVSMGIANGFTTFPLTVYSLSKLSAFFKEIKDEQGIHYGKLFAVIFCALFAGFCSIGKVFAVNDFLISQITYLGNSLTSQILAYVTSTALNIPTWALLVVGMIKLLNKVLPYLRGRSFKGDGTTMFIDLMLVLLSTLGALDYAGLTRFAMHSWSAYVREENILVDYTLTTLAAIPRYATSAESLFHFVKENWPNYDVDPQLRAPTSETGLSISTQPRTQPTV